MRRTLLANAAAFALFALVTACLGLWRWEVLLFQLLVQSLANEFWMDLFVLPLGGLRLFGIGGSQQVDPARMRRAARWSCPLLFLLPLVVYVALAGINFWGEGALSESLGLPLNVTLLGPSLAAQALLVAATLGWGCPPLSYRTVAEALMARREARLAAEGQQAVGSRPQVPPPTHAGVESLPHGLPSGIVLAEALRRPQRCSPQHAAHLELVRSRLREGELAVLSTAPAGIVELPTSSNERFVGSIALCFSALLLYTAIGLFEDDTTRTATRWAVLVLGLGIFPVAVAILRAASRRQEMLLHTDYILTNRRLHVCRDGRWEGVPLASQEVVPGGDYGAGKGDVELCPEQGTDTCKLVNVEHAEELCALLDALIACEKRR